MSARLTSLRPLSAGGGDFRTVAVIERGAGGELGDFVHVEPHRQHEVEEHESR